MFSLYNLQSQSQFLTNSSQCYFEGHSSSIVPGDTALLKPNFNKAPQWFT